MKKIIAIVITFIVCAPLAACSSVTLDDATAEFNEASVALGAVSAGIGTDFDAYPPELIEEIEEYAAIMSEYITVLTADEEPSVEEMEIIIDDCNAIEERSNEIIEEYGF